MPGLSEIQYLVGDVLDKLSAVACHDDCRSVIGQTAQPVTDETQPVEIQALLWLVKQQYLEVARER